jgi:excisionase family DNA binding protein
MDTSQLIESLREHLGEGRVVVIVLQSSASDTPQAAVLTPAQAAKKSQVSTETVLDWIASRQLKASNIGKGLKRGRYRIDPRDLEAFLESRLPAPPKEIRRRSKSTFRRYS